MSSEIQLILIIGAGILLISAIYWMFSVLGLLKRANTYHFVQLQLLQKLLEKEGIEIKLNDEFKKAAKVS